MAFPGEHTLYSQITAQEAFSHVYIFDLDFCSRNCNGDERQACCVDCCANVAASFSLPARTSGVALGLIIPPSAAPASSTCSPFSWACAPVRESVLGVLYRHAHALRPLPPPHA
ncbi:hypothetical protein KC357_g277 [Hortaea werneckii]|nr:hypothetical protein KC357_g277 [Hortaea werneckii]